MLQDDIALQWDASAIAVVIAPYVVNNNITTVCPSFGSPGRPNSILQILTFDTQGISSHPNHYSLPFGAWTLANTLLSKAPEATSVSVPRVFGLVTVPVLPKYAGALAPLSSRLSIVLERILHHFTQNDRNQRVVFISGFKEYMRAVRAMRKHASQLVWFRHFYVTFSRYMWVNEWVEVKISESNT